jgi:hypothetical protein
MTKQRLARLERAVGEFCERSCTLCWGWPFAVVQVEWEEDPDGAGFRETGVRTVLDRDRATDDLRCRRYGCEATVIEVMELKDLYQQGQL